MIFLQTFATRPNLYSTRSRQTAQHPVTTGLSPTRHARLADVCMSAVECFDFEGVVACLSCVLLCAGLFVLVSMYVGQSVCCKGLRRLVSCALCLSSSSFLVE